jgi:hypothetical protein
MTYFINSLPFKILKLLKISPLYMDIIYNTIKIDFYNKIFFIRNQELKILVKMYNWQLNKKNMVMIYFIQKQET